LPFAEKVLDEELPVSSVSAIPITMPGREGGSKLIRQRTSDEMYEDRTAG